MREIDTSLIPYSNAEVQWARHRPPQDRTPLPAPGDEVLYRHDPWGALMDAHVEEVLFNLDDPSVGAIGSQPNPDVWEAQRDPISGAYLILHTKNVIVCKADPWPQLVLTTRPRVMLVTTQEARLRGSAGWLPLDWESRRRPTPDMIEVPR